MHSISFWQSFSNGLLKPKENFVQHLKHLHIFCYEQHYSSIHLSGMILWVKQVLFSVPDYFLNVKWCLFPLLFLNFTFPFLLMRFLNNKVSLSNFLLPPKQTSLPTQLLSLSLLLSFFLFFYLSIFDPFVLHQCQALVDL